MCADTLIRESPVGLFASSPSLKAEPAKISEQRSEGQRLKTAPWTAPWTHSCVPFHVDECAPEMGCNQPRRFQAAGCSGRWRRRRSVPSLAWHTGIAYKAGHSGPSSGGPKPVYLRTVPSPFLQFSVTHKCWASFPFGFCLENLFSGVSFLNLFDICPDFCMTF